MINLIQKEVNPPLFFYVFYMFFFVKREGSQAGIYYRRGEPHVIFCLDLLQCS